MKKGDFIVLVAPYNKAHDWPDTGIIIAEQYNSSRHSYDVFPEHDPFTLDVLWNDGIITRSVDDSWLKKYYFVP